MAKPDHPVLLTTLLLFGLLGFPAASHAADFEALKSTSLGHDPQLIKRKFFNDDVQEVRRFLKDRSFEDLSQLPDSVLIALYSFAEAAPQSPDTEDPQNKVRWFNIEKASDALRETREEVLRQPDCGGHFRLTLPI